MLSLRIACQIRSLLQSVHARYGGGRPTHTLLCLPNRRVFCGKQSKIRGHRSSQPSPASSAATSSRCPPSVHHLSTICPPSVNRTLSKTARNVRSISYSCCSVIVFRALYTCTAHDVCVPPQLLNSCHTPAAALCLNTSELQAHLNIVLRVVSWSLCG
jgi:hypothetical protein